MAKAKKTTRRTNTAKGKKIPVKTSNEISVDRDPANSMSATLKALFTNGVGQINVSHFRRGEFLGMQSLTTSGELIFADIQRSDSLSVNGICAGKASIALDVDSQPETPEFFEAEVIITGYLIV